mmetsp:Transcript_27778/g.24574  ORF Transcript_27778/g.24574 Transcript_27778/m.24574 type:complete len:160 (+) Transcript_27778:249-728(+)
MNKKKSHNLKIIFNTEGKAVKAESDEKAYKQPSCLEQDRIQSLKFKKLNNQHSKIASEIMGKCDTENVNDCSEVLQRNLMDLFIEDLRNMTFNETLEIIQKLEATQSDSIRQLFYLMKNFIIEERHQAESIRKEFKSGMMDPTRKAALYELILGSKRNI